MNSLAKNQSVSDETTPAPTVIATSRAQFIGSSVPNAGILLVQKASNASNRMNLSQWPGPAKV